MTHRGFVVGGELAELAARLGRAAVEAASIEAERTVEHQRERSRQERLEAELAAELARQRADQERQRMDQERIEAERLVFERKCEEQERQRMDQERVEAELWRSSELERQRMERERAEKARVAERGTMLDANAAVWMPAHIDDAELVHRANAEAVRKLERSQAAWRDDGARHVEAERDRGEQETAMWRQRGGEALKAIRDEAVRVEAERIARSYGVRLADDDSTFAAKVRMVIGSKAEDVVDEREEERAKRFLPPTRRTRKTKKGPPNVD